MHRIELYPSVIERVRERLGRAHAFDAMDARRTALLVIDMQNYFVHPDSPAAVAEARAIVPAINELAAGLRGRGGHVAWVRNTAIGTPETWSVYTQELMTPARRDRRQLGMDGEGFAHWHANDVRPEDMQVTKSRFSAFIAGSSDIVAQLDARNIDTLLVAGTVTGVCCESSARDAMMLNYKVTMVADALAAHNDDEHNASLSAFYATFGDVQTVGECLASLDRGSAIPAVQGAA